MAYMEADAAQAKTTLRLPREAKPRQEEKKDERALVEAAQGGSKRAVDELIARSWPDVHRAAFLIVQDRGAAEDIAQETFLAAIDSLDRFDRRRPLRPWLRRIAVNRALDHMKSARQVREVSSELVPEDRADLPDQDLSDETLLALRALDPEERALIVYRHLWGYRPSEIAKHLQISTGAVRTRLHRALEKLRDNLTNEGEMK